MVLTTFSGIQILAILPIILLSYAICKVFYNIFLHPLRSIPGPLIARATILRFQSEAYKGRPHLWIQKLHQKYGSVVRVAPNELSFLDARAWNDIYGVKTHFPRDLKFYGPDLFGEPPGLLNADNVDHKRQRNLIGHAFSDKALKDQEMLLRGYADLMIDKLKQQDARVNLVDWFNFVSIDMIADLTFGEPLKVLEGSSYTAWTKFVTGHIRLWAIAGLINHWPGVATVLQAFTPEKIKEGRQLHMQHSVERVDKRLARKTDRPDMWTYILQGNGSGKDQEKNLSKLQMYSAATMFMTAGTETTGTELAGLTYHLLSNPEKLDRLIKEVRTAFTNREDITMSKLAQLEYLNACIEEGLRIYSPVPIGLPRCVPKGGAMVAGVWVAEGTTVSVPMYAAYRSSSHFKDSDTFVPERWLREAKDEYASDRKDIFNPFSFGPRNCIGKNLAYHEMRLILASLFFHFDVELYEKDKDWTDQFVYMLWEKQPLWVKLRPVN